MKKISLWLLLFTFAVSAVQAQDAGTQQQIDKLSGQIQDLLDTQEKQRKALDELKTDINKLSDKVNTPAANPDNASREDLKNLAEKVQEIDKKRQSDRDLILKEIEKLGKVTATPVAHKNSSNPPKTQPKATDDSPAPNAQQTGYEYTIQAGDTLSIIAKAYRDSEKHVKVTTSQILAANPGLDPNKLYVGKKILIPDPNAK